MDGTAQSELPAAILMDLDGTLSSVEWRRKELLVGKRDDWKRFFDGISADAPNPAMVEVCAQAKSDGIAIILMTGRPEQYRYVSEFWLGEHNITYDALFMRSDTDHTPDKDCKRLMYHQFLDGVWDVTEAYDDRTDLLSLWTDLGIKAVEVTDPGLAPLLERS